MCLLAADPASKLPVLTALTRRFSLAHDTDMTAVAAACHPRFTGADIYGLAADAWMAALRRAVEQVGLGVQC